jgi:hypothetical protein
VPLSDLTTPPSGGVTYTTTMAVGAEGPHTHMFTLSAAMLSGINNNQRIVVTTTVVQSHTHDFSLAKTGVAAQPPSGGSSGGSAGSTSSSGGY